MTKSESARLNGVKSRGPRTPQGQARSSQNALRHGLSRLDPETVVLPGESAPDFDALRLAYADRFQPTDQLESDLVDTLAVAQWRLRRLLRIETHTLTDAFSQFKKDLASAFDGQPSAGQALAYVFARLNQHEPTPALLLRYETQLHRLFDRTLRQLQLLQKARLSDPPPVPAPAPAVALPNEPKPPLPLRPAHPPQHPKILPMPPNPGPGATSVRTPGTTACPETRPDTAEPA